MLAPSSRVTLGTVVSFGDNKGLTELGWHALRYFATRVYKEDKCKVAYITYEDENGATIEGNGIVFEQTSFSIPDGRVIFAIVNKWNSEKGEYEEAVNPF